MPTQLQLEWPDHELSQFYSALNFKKNLNISDNVPFCAELDPPLHFGNDVVKYIQFIDMMFFGKSLVFRTPNEQHYDLPDDLLVLKMKIITPEPVPLLDEWTTHLGSAEDDCFVQLFYYKQSEENEKAQTDMKYVVTLSSKWSNLPAEIERVLKDGNYGVFGRSVGIISKTGDYPILKPLESFFSDPQSYKSASKITILVASSFQEFTLAFKNRNISSKNVPKIPKDLIHRIINQYTPSETFPKNVRRLLKAVFNGGIPVNLFAKDCSLLIKSKTLTSKEYFQKEDFQRTTLSLKVDPDINYLKVLEGPLDNLKDHIFWDSNESTLRSLFWDQVISILFQYDSLGKSKKFHLSSEWRTRNLFPALENRRIDLEASIRPNLVEYPIYQCEIGTDSFNGTDPPKDFSKLIGSLSLTCVSLARDLADNGKDPSLARTYGSWIGGTTIQHVVAHPVIVPSENGAIFDVHCNVTFEDDWKFDIVTQQDISKAFSAQATSPENLLDGRIDASLFPFLGAVLVSSDISIDDDESDSENETETPKNRLEQVLSGNIYKNYVDTSALAKFHSFIRIILARIERIMSAPILEEEEQTKFNPQGKIGFIGAARTGTIEETPWPDRVKEGFAMIEKDYNPKVSYGGKNKKGKRFVFESKMKYDAFYDGILRKLSVFPDSFPMILESNIDESYTGFITYEMEYLERFIYNYQVISERINSRHFIDCLMACVSFGVQTIYGLYLLHEVLGVIHANIKPEHIMFSDLSDSWKFIGFGESFETSKPSSRTISIGDYTAPESKRCGIVTKRSDIYSLGLVMTECLVPILTCKVLDMEEGSLKFDRKGKQIYHQFSLIVQAMCNRDPLERLSVIKSLAMMFDLLEYFEYDESNKLFMAVKIVVSQHEQESKVLEMSTEALKHQTISSEKEPDVKIIPPEIQ